MIVKERQKFHQLKNLFLPQIIAKMTVLTDFILVNNISSREIHK